MKRVRLLPVLLASAVGLVVLLSLGVWQLQRLAWKQGLIAELETAATEKPVTVDMAAEALSKGEAVDYKRVDASGALNMWFDADIDAKMKRTATRPVPAGAVTPDEALGFGLTLAVGSVLALGLLVNVYAGAFLAFTIFFYAVVYTMWLKRWTPQNIVIGGAAGAFPPAVAWVAATGTLDWGAFALFMIIFMWTPPHFWALALFRQRDYAEAGVPMLPNVAGRPHTKLQILIYAVLCLPTVLLPAVTGIAGWLYVIGSLACTLKLVWHSVVLYRTVENSDVEDKASKKLFGYSIIWLFALLTLLLVEQVFGLPLFEAWI